MFASLILFHPAGSGGIKPISLLYCVENKIDFDFLYNSICHSLLFAASQMLLAQQLAKKTHNKNSTEYGTHFSRK
jgi:hypothetical protein